MRFSFLIKRAFVLKKPLLAHLEELVLELVLDTRELDLGFAALCFAVVLNMKHLVERRDERLVRLLQRLDVDDSALGSLRGFDR